MASSRISTKVTHSVLLGGRRYPSPLLVTARGDVAPAAYGANGVYAKAPNVSLTNYGGIHGGAGAYGGAADGGAGGIGVDFTNGGTISNRGAVSGGAGGSSHSLSGGDAGTGVNLAAGFLVNYGSIQGGAGGNVLTYQAGSQGGDGGFGVDLGPAGMLMNYGTIVGGAGGSSQYGHEKSPSGLGGVGVQDASTGPLINFGVIVGGVGGSGYQGAPGAAGVQIATGGVLSNYGTIEGGANSDGYSAILGAGGVGVLASGATIENRGTIDGGATGSDRYDSGPIGGVGVCLDGGTLSNAGTISGGLGGTGGFDAFAATPGGTGVVVAAAGQVENDGTITGGGGGGELYPVPVGAGGIGVNLLSGGLTNYGAISGGNAGVIHSDYEINGDGAGGTGVQLVRGATLTNDGNITGGGASGSGYSNGGIGVVLAAGGSVLNSGMIAGATGGSVGYYDKYAATYKGGDGGDGVDLKSGGTITNNAEILGGNGGFNAQGPGGNGGAGITLAGGASVTDNGVIRGGDGGYGRTGNGNGGAGVYLDGGTLLVAGSVSGGLADTGGTGGAAVQFGSVAGTLVLDPSAVIDGQVDASLAAGDVLRLAGTTGGTLAGLGTQLTGFAVITENAGAQWTLTGASMLSAGASLIVGGQLTVAGSLGGADGARVAIEHNATLAVNGSLGLGSLRFASGAGETLAISANGSVTSTITGFGSGDVIDVGRPANALRYAAGTLTLLDGFTTVEQLHFAGAYTASDFILASDGHGGTDVTYAANPSGQLLPDFLSASIGSGPGATRDPAARDAGYLLAGHGHAAAQWLLVWHGTLPA